jgi:hypothetical protein
MCGVDWIHTDWNKGQWQALVRVVMEFRVPGKRQGNAWTILVYGVISAVLT